MKQTTFSKIELERYSRHLAIPEFGLEEQAKLKCAKVLVVGSGGLGAPILLYLTAAGVGKIGIIDFDSVELSNLHRQILFRTEDIGEPKVNVTIKLLKSLNPTVFFYAYSLKLNSENALSIVKKYDLVVDGTDNFPTRYLINDACVILNKPCVYGAVYRFEGQVSVFNYNNSPNYRDLFPVPPHPDSIPNCVEGGVLGVLPGIIGTMQANEAIKLITQIGEPLAGKLLLFDSLHCRTKLVYFGIEKKNKPITKLEDYNYFCNLQKTSSQFKNIKKINVFELQKFIQNKENFQLIDVREPYEYELSNINGELIPLLKIEENIHRIDTQKKVIFHCRSGRRSLQAIKILEDKYAFTNLYNLTGGLLAWIDKIDNSLSRY